MKKFLIGTVAVAIFAFAGSAFAAYDFGATTLRVGSRGEAVKNVQVIVGATPVDGIFGAMTKAKVMAWQAANGLVADGLFGAASKAKANSGTGTVPATGGTLCPNGMLLSNNCNAPATGPTTLQGGAGDLTIDTDVSKNEESSLKEGEEEVIVYATKLEAEDSDIQVTSVKVSFDAKGLDGASDKADDYLSEVKIFLGDKEVGSVDADDLSETSDVYYKSINLSGAVVSEDDSEYLYVAVSAIDDIDSDDIDEDWYVTIESLRFTDATGAIMTEELGDITVSADREEFSFTDSATDDEFDIKSSSADPDAATLKVEESDTSDEFLVGAFKMDVDEDSSDLAVLELPVRVTVSNNTVALDSIDEIIDTLMVKIDGEEYEADIDADLTAAATVGTAIYLVEFDSDELVIEAGDALEVKIYATFAEQGGDSANYTDGTDLVFSVDSNDMDIENEEEDAVADNKKDGTFTSEDFSLSVADVVVDNFRWSVNTTGTIVDFFFDVEAGDEEFDVLASSITGEAKDGNSSITDTNSTKETTLKGVLSRFSGDSVDDETGGFTLGEDEKTTFRVRYTLTGTNGFWAEITIGSVAGQTVPDDKETSPTATVSL